MSNWKKEYREYGWLGDLNKDELTQTIRKLEKENEKLKAENERLKKETSNDNSMIGLLWIDNINLENENERLKEKLRNVRSSAINDFLVDENKHIRKVIKENKELKAENHKLIEQARISENLLLVQATEIIGLRKAIEEALVKLHEFDEHMSFPNAWADLKRITKILGEASSQEGSKET